MTNNLFHEVLEHNGLEKPDGRPLFQYQLSAEHRKKIAFLVFSRLSGVPLSDGQALFCIWACRKLRAAIKDISGPLKWATLQLEKVADRTTLVAWTDGGLRTLKRTPRKATNNAQLRLNTLYLEGGISLRKLQSTLWKQVTSLYQQVRMLADQVPQNIAALVKQGLVNSSDLEIESVARLLEGLLALSSDPHLGTRPTSAWSDDHYVQASRILNLDLRGDASWIDSLLESRPALKERSGVKGRWVATEAGELKYLLDLPKALGSRQAVYIHFEVDGKRSFVASYMPALINCQLEHSRPLVVDTLVTWNAPRLIALDETDQVVRCPLFLKNFEPPQFPLYANLDKSNTPCVVVPGTWRVNINIPGGTWIVVPITPGLILTDPEGTEFVVNDSVPNVPQAPEGWESLDGVFYQGKNVRTSLPKSGLAWQRRGEAGRVVFDWIHNGQRHRRIVEVILPGMSVQGRIFTDATGSQAAITWKVRLPQGWKVVETGAEMRPDGEWLLKTPLTLVNGDEQGTMITVSDSVQRLVLLCYADPQIFLQRRPSDTLLPDKEVQLWHAQTSNQWWLFRTRRAARIAVNETSFDDSPTEDMASRPGLLLLRILADEQPWQSEGRPAMLQERILHLRAFAPGQRNLVGHHDEIRLTIRNYSWVPEQKELVGLGKGNPMTWSDELPEEPIELTLRAIWGQALPPIRLESSKSGTWALPEDWQTQPSGMYLLCSPTHPDWLRPSVVRLVTQVEPGNLTRMQQIGWGQEVLAELEPLREQGETFESISVRKFRKFFEEQLWNYNHPDWTNLWHLANDLSSLGPDFLYQMKALFEMIRSGGDSATAGFLGLCWFLLAGLNAGADVRLVAVRAERLFNVLGNDAKIVPRMKDLKPRRDQCEHLLRVWDYLPETWIDGQDDLQVVYNAIKGDAQ